MSINKPIILDAHTYIHMYTEFATLVLEYSSLDSIWITDENGDERMTEEKQDEFCHLCDQVENLMASFGLMKEEI